MTKKTDSADPQSGADRKRRYEEAMQFAIARDGSRVRTHVRKEFYVRVEDVPRLAAIDGDPKQIIPTLLDYYQECKEGQGSGPLHLPDHGHREWRNLATDLLQLFGIEKRIDMGLLHQLSRLVKDSLSQMKEEK